MSQSPIEAFYSQTATLRSLAQSSFQKKGFNIKELEAMLNFYYGDTTSANFNFKDGELKNIQESVVKNLQNQVSKYGANINYNNLSTSFGEGGLGKKRIQSETKSDIGTLLSRWNVMLSVMKSTDNKNLINDAKRLEQTYKDFIKYLNKTTRVKIREDLGGRSYTYLKNSSLVKELNDFWMKYKNQCVAHIDGILGEYAPGYILQALKEVGAQGLAKTFSGFKVVGGDRGSSYIDLSNIEYLTKFKKGITQQQMSNITIDSFSSLKLGSKTQNKVDLELYFNGFDRPLRASVKNTNMNALKGISLLKGSSILNLIQDYHDFTNHYLNITQSITDYNEYSNENWLQPGRSLLTMANRTLKLTIALHALIGKNRKLGFINGNMYTQTSGADVMILNMHPGGGKGKFKVIWMGDIVNKIISSPELITVDKLTDTTRWGVKAFENGPKLSYKYSYGRIKTLLNQLHTYQLKVSISPAAFTI